MNKGDTYLVEELKEMQRKAIEYSDYYSAEVLKKAYERIEELNTKILDNTPLIPLYYQDNGTLTLNSEFNGIWYFKEG